MQKRLLAASFIAVVFLLFNGEPARSQSDLPKYEAGGQISVIRFREIISIDPLLIGDLDPLLFIQKESVTNLGFGGRFSYNITKQIAVEGELNFFPADNDDFVEGGRKTQVLAGVKAGFAKIATACLQKPGRDLWSSARSWTAREAWPPRPAFV